MNDLGVDQFTPEKCTESSLKAYGDNTYQSDKKSRFIVAKKVSHFGLKTPQQNLNQPSEEELFNKSPLNFTKESPKCERVSVNQENLS